MPRLIVPPDAAPSLHAIAAAVSAVYRLCLIPPITISEVSDASVTFRTSQFTREANARIIEAMRDTLGATYVVEWVDRDHVSVRRV